MPKLASRLLRNNRLAITLRTFALAALALGAVMMSSQEARAACEYRNVGITSFTATPGSYSPAGGTL